MTPEPDEFLSTRWSVVAAAGGSDGERAREALAILCQTYWYPLYSFVRRLGLAAVDAEDAVQDFFARLISTGDLAAVVRGEGRFRSFLRVAIRNHVHNLQARERAEKRGGGRLRLAIDVPDAERRFALEDRGATPDEEFDRTWARQVIAAVITALQAEYERRGNGELFAALRPVLEAEESAPPLTAVAAASGRNEVAVRVALHRLRARFRERLDVELAGTLADREALEDERERLLRALGR